MALAPLTGPHAIRRGPIEGGDVTLSDGRVLVGRGEETDNTSVAAPRTGLAKHRVDREVFPGRF